MGILLFFAPVAFAQGGLELLEEEEEEEVRKQKDYTIATFKGTRLINFHTIETPGRNTLEYRISHRFGTVNSGIENFYGLDGGASIRLGLDYSHDGRLAFGIGRTDQQKTVDGYFKFRIIRQTTDTATPLSVTLVSTAFCTTMDGYDPTFINAPDSNKYSLFTRRLAFSHQLLIASKITDRFSIQIAPAVIHQNLVAKATDKNTMFAAHALARFKVTKRLALTGEYGQMLGVYHSEKNYPVIGVGLDIETGGHVFQVHVTNTQEMAESRIYPYTSDNFLDGSLRIGFNISRVFSVAPRPKKKPEDELNAIPVAPQQGATPAPVPAPVPEKK